MNKFIQYITNPYRIFAYLAAKNKLGFVSEEQGVKLVYRGIMGKKLNLQNPKTFNEKLQWLKLNDRNPLYVPLVDKHEVRQFIAEMLGKQYIVPEYGCWEDFSSIDFNILPNQFVLKCTHDAGSTIVCRDKGQFDIHKAQVYFEQRLARTHYAAGYEWQYKEIKPRIIAEKYMDDGNPLGMVDYKFYCMNGKAKFFYISAGLEHHESACISFFNLDGKPMPFRRNDYKDFEIMPKMPSKLDEMIEIANKCSSSIGSPFVRVDLYQIDGNVFFSEFTFYPCGGYMKFYPDEYDEKIGSMLIIK